MDQLKPPKTFVFGNGNVAETWKAWQKSFEFFMVATESDEKNDKIKTSILLTCIGERGREIYETFDFTDPADKLKLAPVLKMFDLYCNPRSNKTQILCLSTAGRTTIQQFCDRVEEVECRVCF